MAYTDTQLTVVLNDDARIAIAGRSCRAVTPGYRVTRYFNSKGCLVIPVPKHPGYNRVSVTMEFAAEVESHGVALYQDICIQQTRHRLEQAGILNN